MNAFRIWFTTVFFASVLFVGTCQEANAGAIGCTDADAIPKPPWREAVVFLSADDLQCDLAGPACNCVLLKDRPAEDSRPERKGILAALLTREGPGIDPDSRSLIDNKVAKAISRAVEQSGIRPSQRSRRVGNYVLGKLLADGPGYQDRLAKHASFDDVHCRVRQYTVAQASSEDDRQRLKRVAAREFQILATLEHPGILRVYNFTEHELGLVLLFEHDPVSVRLDHFLAQQKDKLSVEVMLNLIRQIAEVVRFAHDKKVIHRGLCPESILVTNLSGDHSRIKVFNWQTGYIARA